MDTSFNALPLPVKSSIIRNEAGKRIGPLGLIVLLHVGFFYALQSGLVHKAAPIQPAPKEVFATLIRSQPAPAPAPAPEPPKPREVTPKTVPVTKKHHKPPPKPVIKKHVAPAPVVEEKPSPVAAATPATAPPASPEPPAPVPASAPAAVTAPSAPPAPPQPARPKTISGVEYLRPPSPEYPAMSRRMREEGTAILRVLINEHGRAERVELQKSAGSSRLDEAARRAVSQAAFKPYIEDGKALAVYVVIPIKFQLD